MDVSWQMHMFVLVVLHLKWGYPQIIQFFSAMHHTEPQNYSQSSSHSPGKVRHKDYTKRHFCGKDQLFACQCEDGILQNLTEGLNRLESEHLNAIKRIKSSSGSAKLKKLFDSSLKRQRLGDHAGPFDFQR